MIILNEKVMGKYIPVDFLKLFFMGKGREDSTKGKSGKGGNFIQNLIFMQDNLQH